MGGSDGPPAQFVNVKNSHAAASHIMMLIESANAHGHGEE
jgi:hypothetical protein